MYEGQDEGQYFADMAAGQEHEAQMGYAAQAEAETQYQQSLIPNSPQSVLTLFDADKPALERFARAIIEAVKEGHEDPLKVLANIKKAEFAFKQIIEATKEEQKNAASKYGEIPFTFAATEMHYTATKTEYLYEDCGDPEWNDAALLEARHGFERKERETFLKALQKPLDILRKDTGEVITINPPQKKQAMGVKTTVK